MLVAFAAGHVGATLLVAAGLSAAVTHGWLPMSVARAPDVGMSYGATAVLGALTPAIPRRWRPTWIGWWLAVAVAVVGVGTDFTDVGHLLALTLGMVVATRFGSPRPWTYPLVMLLTIASAFGFLVLASGEGTVALAAASGVAGALFGAVVTLSMERGARRCYGGPPGNASVLTGGEPRRPSRRNRRRTPVKVVTH